jgi:hypothetical protein
MFFLFTDECRIHFNFLYQLQRSPIVLEMLKKKKKTSMLAFPPPSPTDLIPLPNTAIPSTTLAPAPTPIYAKPGTPSQISFTDNPILSPEQKMKVNPSGCGSVFTFEEIPPVQNSEEILAQLSVTCLRFNIEVLARARASGCVPSVSDAYSLSVLVGRSHCMHRANIYMLSLLLYYKWNVQCLLYRSNSTPFLPFPSKMTSHCNIHCTYT